MKHKIKIVSLLIVSAMLFFVGCKKNNSENETNEINETPEETFDEVIPEEIIQLLDNCPITNYQDISVFGFNGKSNYPLDNLFAAMCEKAMFLTDSTKLYGVGVQNQHGLAYVPGHGTPYSLTKDYNIARIGTWRDGIECACQEELYGTDCAGFIAHVMSSVGIKPLEELAQKTAHQQVQYFKNELKELNTSFYKGKISVKEFNNVDTANIENGDIIYKLNGNNTEACHIGIFFKPTNRDRNLIMFQSSGSYRYDCPVNRHEGGHGPIQREIHPDTLNKYFNVAGGKARVLRIIDSNWVDLGLTSGNLWATRNVGANSPEESGFYFAWGETQQKSNYVWETYKYWRNNSITKYNETDHLTTLQPNDDAATAHWSNLGNNCRMPTDNDWNELKTQCTQTFTTRNGVKGVLFTATNGNSLFLPAVGFRHEEGIFDGEHYEQYDGWGFYWSSSRSENNPNNASYVRFNSEGLFDLSEYLRLFGLSVRPVRSFP